MRKLSNIARYKLNAVCPYYTMFPLEFPMQVLKRADRDLVVFDPFCGRGTTNFAAQTYGMKSYGLDASPIAVAIAKAKLANTDIASVMENLEEILSLPDVATPKGEFWELAFHPDTLQAVCKLREYLPDRVNTDAGVMLQAIVLGCLHGPRNKDPENLSYFSNQMPRTFSSKPNYSVNYWRKNNLSPIYIDIKKPIKKKADMVLKYIDASPARHTNIICADSRNSFSYANIKEEIDLVISSPPYFGMQTYVQDQWLRNWLIGGPAQVDYDVSDQVSHSSPEDFSASLACVWDNISKKSSEKVKLVIRFGGVSSRKGDYDSIIRDSFEMANKKWHIYHSRGAGSSHKGKRQAESMGARIKSPPLDEKDYFVRLT